jgi:prefoldin subunit 5
MEKLDSLLAGIEEKVIRLQADRRILKQELEQLKNRIEELNQIINQQKEHISQLENIQFVESFTGILQDDSKVRTHERLNELLQEIDKCIEIVSE